MANPVSFTVGPLAAAAAAGIVASNTPAGAGSLALVGGGASVALDAPRKVLVTYGVELAARAIAIGGTNVFGVAIAETLSVPAGAGGTVATEQDFLTLTKVSVFTAWTAAMTVGTNGAASSPWWVVDIARNPFCVGYAFWVFGTVTYQLEATMDDPNAGYAPSYQDARYADSVQALSNVPPLVFVDPVNFATSKGANFAGLFDIPSFALRATLLTGTGSIQFEAVQSGYVGA